MPDDATFSFAAAIHDHLELKRRNAVLEFEMPLASYLPNRTSESAHGVEKTVVLEDEDTVANVHWPE